MKKWTNWTKKQKVVTGIVIAGVAIAGGTGVKVYADTQQKEKIAESKKTLQSEQVSLADLKQAVDTLRDKDNPNFLSKDASLTDLKNIDKQLNKLKTENKSLDLETSDKTNKEVVTLLSEVADNSSSVAFQLDTQDAVNGLFTQDKEVAIKGTTVNKELSIIDDLTISDIEKVVKDTQNKDKLALIPASTNKDMSWEQAITSLTDVATEQVKLIESVTKTVDSFYKDNKIVDTTDIKAVNEAEKQANTIKNEKAKKALLDKIKAVKEAVSNKLKEEAEKQAKSNGGKVVAQADGSYTVEQVTAGNVSQNASSNGSEQGNETVNNGNANNDNSNSTYSGGSSSNGGSYTPPSNNSNSSSASSGSGSSSSNGTWSGNVEWTEGGDIADSGNSNGAIGGGHTWTGGEFDGSGIPEW